MLILTGGEPLARPDIFDIASSAASQGLCVVLGTNGTLLETRAAERLKRCDVAGVGISLDSAAPGFHDELRGVQGAWKGAMRGMAAARSAGLALQVQMSVMRSNRGEIDEVAALASDVGARALNVFFLVCTGRARGSTDLSADEYSEVLSSLARIADRYRDKLMVRARCAPHFAVVAGRADGADSACIAATGYMRVSPAGGVTPCPYMDETEETPKVSVDGLAGIWGSDPLFVSLREPSLKGRCGECEHSRSCGGCRARALASTGDPMETDPICNYEPGRGPAESQTEAGNEPVWSREAEERMARIPVFVRGMVRARVERYARTNGIEEITSELMSRLRKTR